MTVYRQNTNIEKMYVYGERAKRASLDIFAFSHSKTAISFNIFVGTTDTLSVQMGFWHACRLTCIDKFPKYTDKH